MDILTAQQILKNADPQDELAAAMVTALNALLADRDTDRADRIAMAKAVGVEAEHVD